MLTSKLQYRAQRVAQIVPASQISHAGSPTVWSKDSPENADSDTWHWSKNLLVLESLGQRPRNSVFNKFLQWFFTELKRENHCICERLRNKITKQRERESSTVKKCPGFTVWLTWMYVAPLWFSYYIPPGKLFYHSDLPFAHSKLLTLRPTCRDKNNIFKLLSTVLGQCEISFWQSGPLHYKVPLELASTAGLRGIIS